MKKLLLLTSLLLILSCKKEETKTTNNKETKTVEVTKDKNSVTGEIITWGYDGPEGLFATITIKTEANDTIYGFYVNEFGEAGKEFPKISGDEYGEVGAEYKGKTVVAKVKQPPHDYSLDKEDKSVLFTSVVKK